MKIAFISPRKYVQGRGVLAESGPLMAPLGKKPLLLWDKTVRGLVGETMLASLRAEGLKPVEVDFQGEATKEEAERVAGEVRSAGADVVVGVGGGKAIDVAKGAAFGADARLVTVPTIAATDAPTSAATVWYSAGGDFTGFDLWPANPDLVLVDSQVIAGAPARTFAAGMGDALATWLEADAAYKSRAVNLAGGVSTLAARAIAHLGYEILMSYGLEALRAVREGVVTPAVEKVIETNILHSGLGFESSGLATAHMIANPLSNYPECKGLMHGEKVGFGIVTQLCIDEDTVMEEMEAIVDFEIAIGLPVTFADLGFTDVTREKLQPIGDACGGEGSLCGSHVFEVTAESAIDAMIAADALGQERKALLSE